MIKKMCLRIFMETQKSIALKLERGIIEKDITNQQIIYGVGAILKRPINPVFPDLYSATF